MRYIGRLAFGLVTALLLSSCNDFLDITPTGKVIAKTGDEYRALLTTEYNNFPEDRGLATFRSDEMLLDKTSTTSEDYDSFFDIWRWNDDAPSSSTVSFGWRKYYHTIYIANYLLAHKDEISNATQAEVDQLAGEAYMLRAYSHFLLVNLYAEPYTKVDPDTARGVPVQLEADINKIPRPVTVGAVYRQVLSDIAAADSLLHVDSWPTGLNYRFNKISVQALKARVCLYMGRWQEALTAAQAVIKAHGTLENLNNSSAVLPDNYKSVESIVALEQVMTNTYKNAGRPAPALLALYQSGDLRKTKYYKQITASVSRLTKGGSSEYSCSFRTAEQYLIAAECSNELGHTAEAAEYIAQLLAARFRPSSLSAAQDRVRAMNQEQLREEIQTERLRELAFEGFRWFDLRRTTQPSLTKTYQGDTYVLQQGDSRYTLRFPTEATEANPKLSANH